jgi:adenosine kinase
MIEGAKIYIVNDYEWSLTKEKTGLDEDAIAERVEILVITRGEEGSWLRRGSERTLIPIAPPTEVVDPTGCGDAFRAGLIAGMQRGYELEISARMGSLMGALNVAERLTQSLEITEEEFREEFKVAFGEALPSV